MMATTTNLLRISRRLARRRTAVAGIAIVAGAFFVSLFGPSVAPYDPNTQDLKNTMLTPSLRLDTSHILGTDQLGRDILSRLIYGARTSMIIGVAVAGLSAAFGAALGLSAGYYGGATDVIISRITDVFLGFPTFVLAICIAAVLRPALGNTIIVLSSTGWMTYTRVTRSEALKLRERTFVRGAVVIGSTHPRIILRHIFPNAAASVIVLASLDVGRALILEAGLTFVGVGVPISVITWGQMLALSRDYLLTSWWLAAFPGMAITVTVVGFNFLGDWLRDVLDPTLRHQ